MTSRPTIHMRTLALLFLSLFPTLPLQAADSCMIIHGRAHLYGGDDQLGSGMSERATITNPTNLLGIGFKSGLKLESRTPPSPVMLALRLPSTSLPTF